MIEGIVDQHETLVLITSLKSRLLEIQRCLYRLVSRMLAVARKVASLLLHTLDKEHGMVITRNGETWQGYLHRLMEPTLITRLQRLGTHIAGIIIKGGRDIGVILVEPFQIVLGIHQPFRITEERDGCTRILGIKLIQLVEHGGQLR